LIGLKRALGNLLKGFSKPFVSAGITRKKVKSKEPENLIVEILILTKGDLKSV